MRLPARDDDPPGAVDHLRRDDVLFIALGIVPGAVIGGRLAYVAAPPRLLPAVPDAIPTRCRAAWRCPGRSILGAVTGGLVARLFDAPVGRWYTVAAIPMLLALGLGKAANVLGGTGQGLPSHGRLRPRATSAPGRGAASGPTCRRSRLRPYEAIGVARRPRSSSSSSCSSAGDGPAEGRR